VAKQTAEKLPFGSVRVELAFRPVFKPFIYQSEPASAGGTSIRVRIFTSL
jgi:hypothetical protein